MVRQKSTSYVDLFDLNSAAADQYRCIPDHRSNRISSSLSSTRLATPRNSHSTKCRLLLLREKEGADRWEELAVNKVEAGGHGVVAHNLAVNSGEGDATVGRLGEILLPIRIDNNIGAELDAGLFLDKADVLLDGGGKDGLDGGNVLSAAVDGNIVLLDLDEALHDELLQEVGVVLSPGDHGELLAGLIDEILEEIVADLHLLHPALTDLGRSGDALLDLVVLLLLLELLLDVELGLMDEGLFLKVEVVLGLDPDLVGLLMCLLEDEVDLSVGTARWDKGKGANEIVS